jgi:hypothetical protein
MSAIDQHLPPRPRGRPKKQRTNKAPSSMARAEAAVQPKAVLTERQRVLAKAAKEAKTARRSHFFQGRIPTEGGSGTSE